MTFAVLPIKYCVENAGLIADINQAIEALHKLPIADIRKNNKSPRGLTVFSMDWYRAVAILRMRALERGASCEFRERNFVCSAVLVRQIIETAAHCIDAYIFIDQQLRKQPPALVDVRQKLKKSLFGTKIEKMDIGVSPEQILNCIDKTDKMVGKEANSKARVIREVYEELSDFVHPNLLAYQYHIEIDNANPSTVSFHSDGNETVSNRMANHIFTGLLIVELFLISEKKYTILRNALNPA